MTDPDATPTAPVTFETVADVVTAFAEHGYIADTKQIGRAHV